MTVDKHICRGQLIFGYFECSFLANYLTLCYCASSTQQSVHRVEIKVGLTPSSEHLLGKGEK